MAIYSGQNGEIIETTPEVIPFAWDYTKNLMVRLLLKRFRAEGPLLNIGCNTGRAWKGFDVFGIDLNPSAVAIARKKGINSAVADARNLDCCDDKSFGVVLMLDVLEHIEEQERALEEVRRVLCDQGLAIISVPLYRAFWSDHDVRLGHVMRYEPGELRSILESTGFNVIYRSCWNITGILGARVRKKGFGIRRLVTLAAPLLFLEAVAGSIFPLPWGLTEVWVGQRK
jgi:SAM-dependent methyltransferase